MNNYSDIAMECINSRLERKENKLDFGCFETIIKIDNAKKEKEFGKPRGEYYLLDCPNLHSLAPIVYDYLIEQLSSYLKYKITALTHKEKNKILVVCLGNGNIVSDSLGENVYEELIALRNREAEESSLQIIRTDVFGKTGIDSAEQVKAIVGITKPDAVILIDSLCAQRMSRVGTSIQVSDTGLVAGGALGLRNSTINSQLLKCPTLALGVPFVVKAETVYRDFIYSLCEAEIEESKAIPSQYQNLLVAPKDIDNMVKLASFIISTAINQAVLNLTPEEQKLMKL